MTDKAVSIRLNSATKQYEVIVVGYNPLTKEGIVQEIRPVGDFKHLAVNNFKVELIKMGFI